jgi:Zn-finger nucleic acid-binding protein
MMMMIEILSCPLCHANMKKMQADSHYIKKNVEIDKCNNCGSVWFDEFELYFIANLALLGMSQPTHKFPEIEKDDDLNCPCCGIKLTRDNSINIPKSIYIWRCRSCQGCFLNHEDIIEYGNLIDSEKKDK